MGDAGDSCHLYHVQPPEPAEVAYEVPAGPALLAQDLERWRKEVAEARTAMEKLRDELLSQSAQQGIQAQVELQKSLPGSGGNLHIARNIAARAAALCADAVVMLARHRSPVWEFIGASVSKNCLDLVQQPLLLLYQPAEEARHGGQGALVLRHPLLQASRNGSQMLQVSSRATGLEMDRWEGSQRRGPPPPLPHAAGGGLRRLMFVYDDSEASAAAYDWFIQHFAQQGDEVQLVEVVLDGAAEECGVQLEPCGDGTLSGHYVRVAREHGLLWRLTVMPEFREGGQEQMGSRICEKVAKDNTTTLVIAIRSEGPLAELLRGSITNHCTNHSSAPVVLLHA